MPAEYIPLLKWKQGEQLALANLQSAERQRVCPVLEIIPSAVQGKTAGPDGLAPDTSGTLVKDIISAWGSNPVFVDFTPLDPEWRPTSKKHFIDHFFEEARHVGQNWIPVATMQSDAAFRTAVAAATKVDNRGACIRVNINDVVDDAFPKELKELRKALGLTPAELDLLIDAAKGPSGNNGNGNGEELVVHAR